MLSAFKFAQIDAARLEPLRDELAAALAALRVRGTVYLAPEGVNLQCAVAPADVGALRARSSVHIRRSSNPAGTPETAIGKETRCLRVKKMARHPNQVARQFFLSHRWCVEETTLGVQRILPTRQAERGIGAEEALENLTVVAHGLDHVHGPILFEAKHRAE